jgi:glycine C-acetyltransferase
MADKLDFMRQELEAAKAEKRYINIRTMDSPADAWMVVDGKKVLNFCTNNYLGLANHPVIKAAARKAVEEWGVGPGAVRTIAGTQQLHVACEKRIAEFKRVEAALLVQSGLCANQAALPPLVGRDKASGTQDVIFSDRLNHASIIDGARLSGAKIIVYEHCDPADLEAKIQEHLSKFRRGLMVTDGVFSMDGDVAPLDKLYEVAAKYDVLTMVDDAHGEGVLGQGRGIVAHFGLEGKFDVEIGTLSKAFGVMGGVVAGNSVVVDYIRQKARPNLFSSALTPADTAACMAAVDYVESHPELVDRLWENAEYFKAGIKTPVTPRHRSCR